MSYDFNIWQASTCKYDYNLTSLTFENASKKKVFLLRILTAIKGQYGTALKLHAERKTVWIISLGFFRAR